MAARRIVLRRLMRERGPDLRVFRDRGNPIEAFDDSQLMARYRFPRVLIMMLTDLVAPFLNHTRRGRALPAVLQVCMALRFFASGAMQQVLGDNLAVHKSTVCRAIHRVAAGLASLIHTKVKFPATQDALLLVKRGFYEIARFPKVIGCIDGTHVRIACPNEDEYLYINRKGFHSLNIQVVCDHLLKFINVVVRWPRSVHDARVFRESFLFTHLDQLVQTSFLLGDSGYPLKRFLLTPFNVPLGQRQENYNRLHIRTRNCVERTIGVWKGRFRCILEGLRLQPKKAIKIILATVVLHNIAREENLPDPVDLNFVEEGFNPRYDGEVNDGRGMRMWVVNNLAQP